MAALAGAEHLSDRDFSQPHRSPPPIPTIAYDTTQASTSPHLLNEPGRSGGGASDTASNYSERRRGSLGSLLRRTPSHNSALRKQHDQSDEVPPVPAVPATRIAQAHQAAASSQNGGRTSTSSNRKTSTEGRSMLRKSSKLAKAQEQERQEQERLARQRAPPPRLPSHNPLPGIDSFGGDEARQGNPTNFSRPGANNMPSSNYNNNSSSSPAYAVRGAQSSPAGNTNGEYVDGSSVVDRHESMTHRGRYSYASSTVPVNMSSPRRIRRRKDPTPFK